MTRSTFLVLIIACGAAVSCTPRFSPEAIALAEQHRTIAILPPEVFIESMRRTTPEDRKRLEKVERGNLQRELQDWVLRRKAKEAWKIEFLGTHQVNETLRLDEFENNSLPAPTDACRLLGTDAVLVSRFTLRQPMSQALAIALGVLFNTWGVTNQSFAELEIHDARTGEVIWRYRNVFSGSAGSNMHMVVERLMRHASRNLPYRKLN